MYLCTKKWTKLILVRSILCCCLVPVAVGLSQARLRCFTCTFPYVDRMSRRTFTVLCVCISTLKPDFKVQHPSFFRNPLNDEKTLILTGAISLFPHSHTLVTMHTETLAGWHSYLECLHGTGCLQKHFVTSNNGTGADLHYGRLEQCLPIAPCLNS